MSDKKFIEFMEKQREKNKKNPYFKSKMVSILERQEKDAAGEFFRISSKYLKSSPLVKKKMVSLSIILSKIIKNKKDKKTRAIFYTLNEFKRKMGLCSVDIPWNLKKEVSYE